MKKVEENRYPNSATLFKFCKEALELRYEGNVKVIDQDVGAILGYDPADCSHWKKGKKNIRALNTLRSIAEHLKIDERLLIDIASGRIGLDEAIFEFKGYGAFQIDNQHLEKLKKDFFKSPGKWQEADSIKSFEDLFKINRAGIVKIASEVIKQGEFKEAPIYIPELYDLFSDITLEKDANLNVNISVTTSGEGTDLKTTVYYGSNEMRPYIRFLTAKELYKHLVRSKDPLTAEFHNSPDQVLDIQANLFAGHVLIPSSMLQEEVDKINSSLDIISQLADAFWVSKALMNKRMRDFMENLS